MDVLMNSTTWSVEAEQYVRSVITDLSNLATTEYQTREALQMQVLELRAQLREAQSKYLLAKEDSLNARALKHDSCGNIESIVCREDMTDECEHFQSADVFLGAEERAGIWWAERDEGARNAQMLPQRSNRQFEDGNLEETDVADLEQYSLKQDVSEDSVGRRYSLSKDLVGRTLHSLTSEQMDPHHALERANQAFKRFLLECVKPSAKACGKSDEIGVVHASADDFSFTGINHATFELLRDWKKSMDELNKCIQFDRDRNAAAKLEQDKLEWQVQTLVHQLTSCRRNLLKAEIEVDVLHDQNNSLKGLTRDMLAAFSCIPDNPI